MLSNLPVNLAYNKSKWAYNFERPNRKPYQIIRIARGEDSGSQSSKLAKDFIGTIFGDKTRAGEDWSFKELDTKGRIYKSDLAVVVGEILSAKPDLSRSPISESLHDFDERKHCVIEKQDTRIAVAKFTNNTANLYALYNKEDKGLCGTIPLAQNLQDRIVLYQEWVTSQSSTAEDNWNNWEKQIVTFISDYRDSHDFLDAGETSFSTTDATGQPPVLDHAGSAMSDIMKALSLFNITSNVEHIRQAKEMAERALGQLPNRCLRSDEEKILDILITSREEFLDEEAREVVKACQVCVARCHKGSV